MLSRYNGFTIPELALAMAVISILLGVVVINLLSASQKTSLTNAIAVFISDLRDHQAKAMTGDTQGTSQPSDYGVYFQQDSYILFQGSSYNPSDSLNLTVKLQGGIEFVSPPTQVVFLKGSGELNTTPVSLTIRHASGGEQKTIQINRYGVTTSVN